MPIRKAQNIDEVISSDNKSLKEVWGYTGNNPYHYEKLAKPNDPLTSEIISNFKSNLKIYCLYYFP
ncbi:MAG: hypothetical protein CMH63_00630 [Nanoarchaeota archaeon]|jgi:hypothetical protein|nr:hypothetical protein [Nanoarchaeota archaeon]